MSHFIDAEIVGLAGKAQSITIKFDRHLSIVYGLNGSGKTSLLKILHSAMTGDARSIQNVPFTQAIVRFRSLSENAVFTRTLDKLTLLKPVQVPRASSGRLGLLARAASQKPEPAWSETVEHDQEPPARANPAPKSEQLVSFNHRYLPTSRLYVGAPEAQLSPFDPPGWTSYIGPGLSPTTALTEETLDRNFAEALARLWASYTSEIGQSVRAAQAKGLANIIKAVMSGQGSPAPTKHKLDLQRAYESVKQFLERQGSPGVLGTFTNFSSRYNTEKSLQAVVQDIYSVEQEVAAATEPQRRLERLIHRLYSGNKRVVFNETSIVVETAEGEQIGLESLSSGEKHLIRMFVECLIAGPNAILIDEPEISAHIDWQRELMDLLHSLNQSAQLIVATHSPEIMAEIPDERIVAL